MATSIVSLPRNISSSVTLLDNVSHYDPFLCRSPHSLKVKAPLTVQEQRIFFAGVQCDPDFYQDASDVRWTVGQALPFSDFSSRLAAGHEADLNDVAETTT
jgi:hypothetical protein